MAEQNKRDVSELSHGIPGQPVGVVHRRLPATREIPLRTFLADGFAVPHMILGHHQNTLSVQEIGKAIIALHILRDAVHNLEHRPYL